MVSSSHSRWRRSSLVESGADIILYTYITQGDKGAPSGRRLTESVDLDDIVTASHFLRHTSNPEKMKREEIHEREYIHNIIRIMPFRDTPRVLTCWLEARPNTPLIRISRQKKMKTEKSNQSCSPYHALSQPSFTFHY